MAKAQQPFTLDVKASAQAKTKLSPENAPAITEIDVMSSPVGQVTRIISRKRSFAWRLITTGLFAFFSFLFGFLIWEFFLTLSARNVLLGQIFFGILIVIILGCLIMAVREFLALLRQHRIDAITHAITNDPEPSLQTAQHNISKVVSLTRAQSEFAWAHARFDDLSKDVTDGDAYYQLAEQTLIAPQDQAAKAEIAQAARIVATATALIPLALADVVAAMFANIRMIRRISEIYGGRPGGLSSWRLLRKVAMHLLATGAVAVGDDMLGSLAGGGVLSKLSRRFGEGLINGALTARVGIAAMEMCRPMPFKAEAKPKTTALIKDALAGFISK